jgi:hypothetical protein
LPREWMPEMERAERVRAYGRGVAQTMGDLLPVTPLDIAGGAAAGMPAVARGMRTGAQSMDTCCLGLAKPRVGY